MGELRRKLYLGWLRRRMRNRKPGSLVRCLDYTVRINDGPNFYILYKDIFMSRIYHFEARRQEPLILDCGSNIGISILYFKHIYPKARVVGFEADPRVFPLLEENIRRNRLENIELVNAALSTKNGELNFYSNGKYASFSSSQKRIHVPGFDRPSLSSASIHIPDGWKEYKVSSARLMDYLSEPVDFLKMNIEGSEYEVLLDSASRLRQIREMVVEYHHLPGLDRTLHKILSILDGLGFEYLINDFDSETNGRACPPFHLTPETRYYLLIYARQIQD